MNDIYKRAYNKWGKNAQILMIIEEMSELSTELCHVIRNRGDGFKVAEEVADVELMLEQIKYIFDIEKSVEAYKEQKLRRLEERLSK